MSNSVSTALKVCRVCSGTNLQERLALGTLALSTFPEQAELLELPRAPLTLVECANCTAVQLRDTVHPELLFSGDYWYASGINGTMREELRHVVRSARQRVRINDGDWVLDIGANDGTLINAWREHLWEGKPLRYAVEPSPTFAIMLGDIAELVETACFPTPFLAANEAGKFKAITSIAMFYAVPDPVGFAREVARLLHPEGVWVVQMQDLHQMVIATAFDNICHEHLIYYTAHSFWQVCQQAGLQIVEVEPRRINGGSLRFTVQHQAGATRLHPADYPPVDWPAFEERILERIAALQEQVQLAKDYGHLVDLLGASTKGNTLLQLAALGPRDIRQCWERHPRKVGRYTVTGIPIVSEEQGRESWPDLLVCPIWQFHDAIIERERRYLEGGGRIYFPLPTGEMYAGGR